MIFVSGWRRGRHSLVSRNQLSEGRVLPAGECPMCTSQEGHESTDAWLRSGEASWICQVSFLKAAGWEQRSSFQGARVGENPYSTVETDDQMIQKVNAMLNSFADLRRCVVFCNISEPKIQHPRRHKRPLTDSGNLCQASTSGLMFWSLCFGESITWHGSMVVQWWFGPHNSSDISERFLEKWVPIPDPGDPPPCPLINSLLR